MAEAFPINTGGVNLFDFKFEDEPEEEKPKKKATKPKLKPKKSEPENEEEETEQPKKTKKKVTIPKATEEEAEAKEKLLMILQRYSSSPRLGPMLKKEFKPSLTSSKITRMSIPELEELVTRVRTRCNNKSNTQGQDKMIKLAMQTSENVITGATKGKLDVIGTTEMCFADEEWLDMLEQIKIEYLSFAQMSLPLRFTFATASISYKVAMEKRKEKVIKENPDLLAPPPPPVPSTATHNVEPYKLPVFES